MLIVLIWAIARPAPVKAQVPTVGDCVTGEAEAFLDVGNVRAKILNDGGLFWNGGDSEYEVPRGGGVDAIFRTTLLLAAKVGDDVRTAATLFGPMEYWPGPIPADGSAPHECDRFDRIYEVRSTGDGLAGGVAGLEGDIHGWPAHLGAPFVDRSGSPNSYDPDDGDYPELVGDQMLWWIMNDRGSTHEWSDSDPLGVEVRVTAFAFDDFGGLENQTFYRYRIRNRSSDTLRAMHAGLFHDVDLGWAFDDYMASDSVSGMAYFYNADNEDEGSYGAAPPAVGFTVLRRPVSTVDRDSPECSFPDNRTAGLTNHMLFYGGGGPRGDPTTAGHIYDVLRSRWKDGTHLVYGGEGYPNLGPGVQTNLAFTGDPATGSYWSEVNFDGEGSSFQASDRRSISSAGPFCLGPGDETEVVFAVVWARASSNLDSINRLRATAAGLQGIADDLLEPRTLVPSDPPTEEPASELAASVYPNPVADKAIVRLGLPQPMDVRVDVFDSLGRRVRAVAEARLNAGDRRYTVQTADWPPGVYLVRMQLDNIMETRRLVVAR